MNFIAFDLETTGRVPGVDRIVEIGAVRFVEGKVDSVFCTLVDPGMSIPAEASAVNGITNDMLVGKPKIEELMDSFVEFCGNDMLVAHNAPFDTQFIVEVIRQHECTAPGGVVVDTLPISRKVLPGLPNYKLGTLVKHLQIPESGFHRAEEDATYVGHLLWHLMGKINPSRQIPISNLVALTGKPEFKFPIVERKPKQLSLLF